MSEAYLKEIQLPSSGKFYGGQIPDGMISIEPLGTKEEKLFASGAETSLKVLDAIFDSCVTCPIDHRDLVLGDRMHLLVQLRCISYGSSYEYPFRCSECGKRSWGSTDLNNLHVRTPQGEDDDPSRFAVKLPVLGTELQLRLLTGRDEEKIQRYIQQLNAKTRGKSSEVEFIYRLARRIESIDGNEAVGIREAMEFVEGIKGLDSLHLRDEIQEHDVGPELEVEDACNYCGFLNGPMPMPIDTEFFRPRRRSARTYDHLGAAEALDAS